MTTITFEEDIKIDKSTWSITILKFLDILKDNGFIPELKELNEKEVTPEILEAFENSKKKDISEFVNL